MNIKAAIKRGARFILRHELQADVELIARLRSYALPHMPALVADGETDQTYAMQYQVDVNGGFCAPPNTRAATLKEQKR